jgi:hypothetical protein
MRHARLILGLSVLLAGCVSPLVNFTPYSTPYFPKEEFERLFTSWKAGRAVTWEVRYKGSSFSEDELVVKSDGQGSLGPLLPTSTKQATVFTVAKADLTRLVDKLVSSNVLSLYDGHYGAYTQSGGAGAAAVRLVVGGLEKRVSKDPGLSSALSPEAGSIQAASDAVLELSRKYLK